MSTIQLELLRSPFRPSDIEWRVQRSGLKDGKGWVQAVAYIDNRAVQNRLDEVCGPENWKNEFQPGPDGGVIAGISIKLDGEWITKWDGAENTDIEAVKGGLSDSMKRAAVQWGIGRYLYELEGGYAPVQANGEFFIKIWKYGANKKTDKPDVTGYWNPPTLPASALPVNINQQQRGADIVTGIAKPTDEPDDQPTGAQIVEIKTKWTQAGGTDIKARNDWIKTLKTRAQAAQAIKKLDEKIERQEAEQQQEDAANGQ